MKSIFNQLTAVARLTAAVLTLPLISHAAIEPEEAASYDNLNQQLLNPLADIITLPIQNHFEWGGGFDGDGFRYQLNIMPVIPIHLSEDWNLIARTIISYVDQENIFGNTSQSGLTDSLQSFFFSPSKPNSKGITWGIGPAILLPTATDDLLGFGKWGAGPNAIVLRQQGSLTYGLVAKHAWSFAGDSDRVDVNASFVQPFFAYKTKTFTSFLLTSETVYDWRSEQATVPLDFIIGQMVKIAGRPVQFQIGARYYLDGPSFAPDWGLQFSVNLLWPK
jgi:hypothetical protein